MGSYWRLLKKNSNFRNLWLATIVSYAGDWFNLLASAALINHLGNGGVAVSYLFLARFLPLFFLSPFTGVLADRYDRKRILILTDVLRAVTVFCFILVQVTGQIWLLYLLTIIQFSLSALFSPTHSAVIPNLVETDDLVTANALDGFTWSTMLAIGALLGGIATALFGISLAFTIDALSFLWSAWFISRITGPTRQGEASSETHGLLDFVDGLRYLRDKPFILAISLVKAGGALAWGAMNVLELPLAAHYFPLGDKGSITLSIFYTMTGIGSGLGPLVVRRWLGDRQKAVLWGITGGFALLTLGIYWIAVAGTLPAAAAASLLRALGGGLVWVFSGALLQMAVVDQFRGRVFAFEFAAFTLTQSIAILWAGLAQDQWGLDVRQVIYFTSFAGVGVLLLWLIFQLSTIYRQRRPKPTS